MYDFSLEWLILVHCLFCCFVFIPLHFSIRRIYFDSLSFVWLWFVFLSLCFSAGRMYFGSVPFFVFLPVKIFFQKDLFCFAIIIVCFSHITVFHQNDLFWFDLLWSSSLLKFFIRTLYSNRLCGFFFLFLLPLCLWIFIGMIYFCSLSFITITFGVCFLPTILSKWYISICPLSPIYTFSLEWFVSFFFFFGRGFCSSSTFFHWNGIFRFVWLPPLMIFEQNDLFQLRLSFIFHMLMIFHCNNLFRLSFIMIITYYLLLFSLQICFFIRTTFSICTISPITIFL